ncbi:hypothetical protein J7T55_003005 [Diaporthe amygdali]|uniref:uncharacterized protein n=1 Tax=Phomopsis amygdali TaxID=1214568 RepID=UPI0022FE51AB|nr:uncharacterized protein J7T55_003005 [Diaporthe amygdali]KAJ0122492.1 hypothetical protein J7T55_003005 [Diaporthe amygdali]
MHYYIANYAALAASLFRLTQAVDSVTVPSTIAAGTSFQLTVDDLDSADKYRVYLAAALGGDTGPTCWLVNSTALSSSSNFTIPAAVGPSASYYSIGVGEVDGDEDDITYSNKFSFTGGTANYTEYETHLDGSPFWDADDLPCSAYACARKCADASYPDDLTDENAYNTMKECINACPGVTETSQTTPAAVTSSSASTSTSTSSSSSTSSSGDASSTNGDDDSGAPAAAVQQVMVVGMASVAGLAIQFL